MEEKKIENYLSEVKVAPLCLTLCNYRVRWIQKRSKRIQKTKLNNGNRHKQSKDNYSIRYQDNIKLNLKYGVI